VAPKAPELTALLQRRAVVRLPALDALPTGRAVDARRLKGELGQATDLALVTRVDRHLLRRPAGLRVLKGVLNMCTDALDVKALQQGRASVLVRQQGTQRGSRRQGSIVYAAAEDRKICAGVWLGCLTGRHPSTTTANAAILALPASALAAQHKTLHRAGHEGGATAKAAMRRRSCCAPLTSAAACPAQFSAS